MTVKKVESSPSTVCSESSEHDELKFGFWLHALHGVGSKPEPLKIHAEEDALNLARRTAEGLPWCADTCGYPCQVVGSSLCLANDDAASPSMSISLLFLRIASCCCEISDLAVVAAVSSDTSSSEMDAWIILCKPQGLEDTLLQLGSAGCIRGDFEQACTIEGVIGYGSFSKVIKGHLVGNTHPVAAKRLAETVHADRVQREVAMLLACQANEHVIGFFGAFQETSPEKRWILVLERAAGGDLFDYIRQVVRIGEFSAWYILRGIMLALKHLHGFDVPIVHRDVKAENVLLTIHGEARLSDFGFACHITDKVEMKRQCGSPGCTAPELLLGQPYDCKVDCFGAGCVLYFMLIGKLPFVAPDVALTLRRNERCQLDFSDQTILECWDSLSSHVKDLLHNLLRRDADSRLDAAQSLQSSWLLQVPSHSLKQRHSHITLNKPKELPRRKRRSNTTPDQTSRRHTLELRGGSGTLTKLDKICEETGC